MGDRPPREDQPPEPDRNDDGADEQPERDPGRGTGDESDDPSDLGERVREHVADSPDDVDLPQAPPGDRDDPAPEGDLDRIASELAELHTERGAKRLKETHPVAALDAEWDELDAESHDDVDVPEGPPNERRVLTAEDLARAAETSELTGEAPTRALGVAAEIDDDVLRYWAFRHATAEIVDNDPDSDKPVAAAALTGIPGERQDQADQASELTVEAILTEDPSNVETARRFANNIADEERRASAHDMINRHLEEADPDET